MKKLVVIIAGIALSLATSSAFSQKETARYFNGPTVSQVGDTRATFSLSPQVLGDITQEERSGVYFEYFETNKVCIAIYPTPEACLPKKTEVGRTEVTVGNLNPNTSYTVVYKRDNTIRCITTPCPTNEYQSLSVEFVTKSRGDSGGNNGTNVQITRNLWLGSRGMHVIALQTILIQEGYLKTPATGYFGRATYASVQMFQRSNGIPPTGYVGPLTRKELNKKIIAQSAPEERFEGIITAYSTACFADGECSITVDDKKVVTTIGWSQAIVGSVTGIPDFGSVENKIGARAKVYAKKTAEGYTLYGSKDYYIEVQ